MNIKIRTFLGMVVLVFSTALTLNGPCLAQTVKIYTEPLAPIHYEVDGEIRGIATEIVQAIFNEADIEAQIEIYPWKRAYQKALTDSNCFIYTINRTARREPLFKWIGPIMSKKTYLYKMKGRNDINLINYDDVRKFTTAVILGHSLTTRLIDLGFREGKEIITTPNKKVQIKVFLRGRSDLITGNQYTIYQSLKDEGYSITDVEPALFISSKGYYLGANINTSQELVDKLQAANQKVQESGLVEKIIEKYIN